MTSVAYGIAMPASRGIISPPTFCAQSLAFFGRLAAEPNAPRKALYDALISSLVSAGVWNKLDALYMFAAADQATGLTNLLQSSYGGTAVNAPAFTPDQGFTGANTRYVDTNFNPSTAAGRFQQDNASVFAWGSLVAGANGETVGSLGVPRVEVIPRYGGNTFYMSLNDGETSVSGAESDGSGLRVLSRNSNTSVAVYKGSTLLTNAAQSSTGLPASDILFLRGANGSYTGVLYCGGFGSALNASDVAALFSALHTYLHAVAGVA